MTDMVTISRKMTKTSGMYPDTMGEHTVHDRQSHIANWNQDKLQDSKVLCIGTGGLGSKYLQNLARMGIGHLIFCDSDFVELSNLNRQFFYEHQKAQREFLEKLRERPVWWVVGTSLGFEALVLCLAGFIFCRRDY